MTKIWFHKDEIEQREKEAREMLKQSVGEHKKYLQGYVNSLFALRCGL